MKFESMEAMVRHQGFEDEREFHKMVASVDLRSPAARARFHKWKMEDGTKAGLEALLPRIDEYCSHGLAPDMHCCDCSRSGFLFNADDCTCCEGKERA